MTGPWLDHPFHVDDRARTATTGVDDHVRDLIEQVLFTSPGERVMRPDFGCGLGQLVFEPLSDALAAATQQLVHGALLRWLEEWILVERVSVEVRDAALAVTVAYTRRDTGEREQALFRREAVA
jgi:phage baseplate assembly protein W